MLKVFKYTVLFTRVYCHFSVHYFNAASLTTIVITLPEEAFNFVAISFEQFILSVLHVCFNVKLNGNKNWVALFIRDIAHGKFLRPWLN